jgi:hypothetical protein
MLEDNTPTLAEMGLTKKVSKLTQVIALLFEQITANENRLLSFNNVIKNFCNYSGKESKVIKNRDK